MSDLAKILDSRLNELGCERLPATVKTKLAESVSADLDEYARKRVARLNGGHVARAFKQAFLAPKKAAPAA